jgi:uncharacterized protein GlcG (DUF336 family)
LAEALTIKHGEKVIGGIGVSGLSEERMNVLSYAAIKAVLRTIAVNRYCDGGRKN